MEGHNWTNPWLRVCGFVRSLFASSTGKYTKTTMIIWHRNCVPVSALVAADLKDFDLIRILIISCEACAVSTHTDTQWVIAPICWVILDQQGPDGSDCWWKRCVSGSCVICVQFIFRSSICISHASLSVPSFSHAFCISQLNFRIN